MSHSHLTVFSLLESEGGTASREAAEIRDLRRDCVECDRAYRRFVMFGDRRRSGAAGRPRSKDLAILEKWDHQAAPALAESFLAAPPQQRRELIDREAETYATPAVIVGLLARARELMRHAPREALELHSEVCRLAHRVPEALYGRLRPSELQSLAEGHRANALRVTDDLQGADGLWENLRAHLRHLPVEDGGIRGELDSLEASLRQDQRRFGEAAELLASAESHYRRLDDRRGLTKVLIKWGIVSQLMKDQEQALRHFSEAARLLHDAEDPRLPLMVVHNQALSLCELRRFAEARTLVEQATELYAACDDEAITTPRLWLEATVALGLGEDHRGEKLLLTARDAFLELGQTYSAALVGLDLAEIYLAQGRHFSTKRLAVSLARIFGDQGVPAELAKALQTFRRAAFDETLSRQLIAAMRQSMQLARGNSPLHSPSSGHPEP
ncbi:MAG: hypothetical protein AAF604_01215 [Acidobacteriota bacterium]